MLRIFSVFALLALGSTPCWATCPNLNTGMLRCINNPAHNQRLEAKVLELPAGGHTSTFVRLYDITVPDRKTPQGCAQDLFIKQVQINSNTSGVQDKLAVYAGSTGSTSVVLTVNFDEQTCTLKVSGWPDQDKMLLERAQ